MDFLLATLLRGHSPAALNDRIKRLIAQPGRDRDVLPDGMSFLKFEWAPEDRVTVLVQQGDGAFFAMRRTRVRIRRLELAFLEKASLGNAELKSTCTRVIKKNKRTTSSLLSSICDMSGRRR